MNASWHYFVIQHNYHADGICRASAELALECESDFVLVRKRTVQQLSSWPGFQGHLHVGKSPRLQDGHQIFPPRSCTFRTCVAVASWSEPGLWFSRSKSNRCVIVTPYGLLQDSHRSWQTRYGLLLWLTMVVLIPFDLSSVDSSKASRTADKTSENSEQPKGLISKLIFLGKRSVLTIASSIHRRRCNLFLTFFTQLPWRYWGKQRSRRDYACSPFCKNWYGISSSRRVFWVGNHHFERGQGQEAEQQTCSFSYRNHDVALWNLSPCMNKLLLPMVPR